MGEQLLASAEILLAQQSPRRSLAEHPTKSVAKSAGGERPESRHHTTDPGSVDNAQGSHHGGCRDRQDEITSQ